MNEQIESKCRRSLRLQHACGGVIKSCEFAEPFHAQVQALESEREEKLAEVERMRSSTKEKLWKDDLDSFEASYNAWLVDEEKAAQELRVTQNKAQGRQRAKGMCFGLSCKQKPGMQTLP